MINELTHLDKVGRDPLLISHIRTIQYPNMQKVNLKDFV